MYHRLSGLSQKSPLILSYMPPAPLTKSSRLECPYHGRGRLATREEDNYVETWGCCTCYVLCTSPVHEGIDWLFWVDPITGLGKCDDEASKTQQVTTATAKTLKFSLILPAWHTTCQANPLWH
ncbi:hypothetical protein OPQ81_000304 [Rhizoctonia solani]|nr:hypothetical protein OPQ81_000304 [Rhizoctonia solani]